MATTVAIAMGIAVVVMAAVPSSMSVVLSSPPFMFETATDRRFFGSVTADLFAIAIRPGRKKTKDQLMVADAMRPMRPCWRMNAQHQYFPFFSQRLEIN